MKIKFYFLKFKYSSLFYTPSARVRANIGKAKAERKGVKHKNQIKQKNKRTKKHKCGKNKTDLKGKIMVGLQRDTETPTQRWWAIYGGLSSLLVAVTFSESADTQTRNYVQFDLRDTHFEHIYNLRATFRVGCVWVERKTKLNKIEKQNTELNLYAITFYI